MIGHRTQIFSSFILVILLVCSLINSVGASSTMWSQTYGGKPYETAESIIETSDGGFAIAGWRWHYVGMILIKTDNFGNMKWMRTYGKNKVATDRANSVIETPDGGLALAGYQRSGNSSYDFLLVKTSEYGIMEWNQTYGGAEWDDASSLIVTSDGGFALAGRTDSFGAGSSDFWLIKTDVHGNMEWNQTYGGPDSEKAFSLVETSDGGFALAGIKRSYFDGIYKGQDLLLVKTDAQGKMEWNQTYSGEVSYSASLVERSDGGFALASGGLIVKTDKNGKMEWNQTYTFSVSYAYATTSLIKTSDGGYAIARGESLVKTDSNGEMLWNQTYKGSEIRSLQSLIETSYGEYALAGFYGKYDDPEQADVWFIKTDEYGHIPEFPSWIIPPLFLIFALIVVSYRKELTK